MTLRPAGSKSSSPLLVIRIASRSYAIQTKKTLILVIGIAIFFRLVSAIYQGNVVSNLPGIYDQISYDGLARRVAEGHGFSFAQAHWPATRAGEPTAHWSFLYTLYLVANYELFGTYPLIPRLLQALFAGCIQPLLLWRIGNRLFNPTVGLVAAALHATYVYFIYYAGALVTETFYITGILWTFDVALRIVSPTDDIAEKKADRSGMNQWLVLGLAIGTTVLLRQLFLLFVPFLFFWIWWNLPSYGSHFRGRRLGLSALKGLSFTTVVVALMILPFTIRNQRVFGTFVLLNTNAGYAFFWGNHPIHGTDFMSILPENQPSYFDLIPRELLNLNEAQLDRALLDRGIAFVVDDPERYLQLSISRLYDFFIFWPSSSSSLISNLSRLGSFGVLLPFIIFGFWVESGLLWKFQSMKVRRAIILLIGFMVVYTLIHLASWALVRYRLPVDAILLLFAAVGIERLIRKYVSG